MKSLVLSLLTSVFVLAGSHLTLTGQVTKIESGIVTLKTEKGDKVFKLKALSKDEAQQVTKETGTKKTITLNVPIESLSK